MAEPVTDHLPLGAWLAAVAEALGVAPPPLSRDEHALILDLARIAAHRSERIAAPITAFLAGTVLADLPADERAARLRDLVGVLDRASTGSDAERPASDAAGGGTG